MHDELLEQALVYATINGEVAAIDVLVQRGADIAALPSGFDIRLTALHWAAEISRIITALHREKAETQR